MATLIRPGLMIALKSNVSGGIHYTHGAKEENGNMAKWETTRVIDDPEEHDRAVKCRGKALATIRGLCAATAFGLLCPEDKEAELRAAIGAAQGIVKGFNSAAQFTRVSVFALVGRVASTDEQAARAIGEEVRELIEGMNVGIDKLDPEAIRTAATKAKSLATMLQPDQAEKVNGAIEAARKAARTLVKRVEKGGEVAAVVLADIQRGALESARIAFLDFEPEGPAIEPLPAVEAARFADLDSSDDVGDAGEGEAGPEVVKATAPEVLAASAEVA